MSTPSVQSALQLFLYNLDKTLKFGTLVKASSEPNDVTRGSLLYDIIQAQLALWTLVFSILYSYAWQQHRKKFIFSLFFIVPTVFTVCCAISALLTVIVILGRLFSTPIGYTELLKYGEDPTTGQTTYPRRHRSYSGTSCRSSMSVRSALSVEDVQLPVPLCRRHSSNGSINGEP
uniref:Transmembrane protein n=1 Tax=Ascaris lumbricoides TaxID=6252 RepID=A0A0M3IUF9_ASCLU